MRTGQPRLAAPRAPRLLWWKELVLVVVFYVVYSAVRNQFGSADVPLGSPPVEAFDNAIKVIDVQEALHLFFEPALQHFFLGWTWFIKFWNVFYGSAHFVVTGAAFIYLYKKAPRRFTQWRNTLGFMTALAIIGFALFPLMPPRLLDKPAAQYGGLELAQERGLGPFEIVDTLAEVGGLWSFDSGTMKSISNQYAAMPSLHTGWSTWVLLALWPVVRRRWVKALLLVYPVATVFCIMVTGNHFWLDAVGGLVVLGAGYTLGTFVDRWYHGFVLPRRRRVALGPLDPPGDDWGDTDAGWQAVHAERSAPPAAGTAGATGAAARVEPAATAPASAVPSPPPPAAPTPPGAAP